MDAQLFSRRNSLLPLDQRPISLGRRFNFVVCVGIVFLIFQIVRQVLLFHIMALIIVGIFVVLIVVGGAHIQGNRLTAPG